MISKEAPVSEVLARDLDSSFSAPDYDEPGDRLVAKLIYLRMNALPTDDNIKAFREAALLLAEEDPRRLITLFGEGTSSLLGDAALTLAAQRLAGGDVEENYRWIRNLPEDSWHRRTVLGHFLKEVAAEDPEQAFEWAVEGEVTTNGVALWVLEHWQESDPEAAIDKVNSLESPLAKSFLIPKLLGGWARSAPAEAVQWMDDNAEAMTGGQVKLYAQILAQTLEESTRSGSAIGKSQLEEVISTFDSLGLAALKAEYLVPLKARLADDQEELDEIMADIRNPVQANHMAIAVFERSLTSDLASAIMVANEEPSPRQRSVMKEMIAERWAETDPASAMDWALQSETPIDRMPAVRATLQQWASEDSVAAAKKLGELRESDSVNFGILAESFAKGLAEREQAIPDSDLGELIRLSTGVSANEREVLRESLNRAFEDRFIR